MRIIAQKDEKSPILRGWWLVLHLWGNGDEWEDLGLPMPHYFRRFDNGFPRYTVGWLLEGSFLTKKEIAYYSDVVKRFLIAFPFAEWQPFPPKLTDDCYINDYRPLGLAELAELLPPLPRDKKRKQRREIAEAVSEAKKAKQRQEGREPTGDEDILFHLVFPIVVRRAYADGHVDGITDEYVRVLFDTENALLKKRRSNSDIKSKVKSVVDLMHNEFVFYPNSYKNWTKEERAAYMREYRRKRSEKEGRMTKTEAAQAATEVRSERARARVISAITGLLAQSYKKKNGKWNISKIASDCKVNRRTATKYVEEWEAEKEAGNLGRGSQALPLTQ